jgi:hypothetical protein
MKAGSDDDTDAESGLIRVELRLDGASPRGRATAVDGGTRDFSGWVGLMSAVDALVAGDAARISSVIYEHPTTRR